MSFVPWHAMSSAYSIGPAYYILGPLPWKGRVQNSVASSTNVYTTAHPGICLNNYDTGRVASLIVHTCDLQRPKWPVIVPATSRQHTGACGFFHFDPTACNCLPPSFKDPNITFSVFKNMLKTRCLHDSALRYLSQYCISTGHVAPWSLTLCTNHLHQDKRSSWILSCWSII